ncbi:Torsin-1B [Trichinella murrelli]|uniref:Torsin-1B n=1 Tax=Trichinella murrelli TaxID=144512 RepID=A0A0V0U157_9BILA|nr:Torsin-1B [Trichinella murrelli]
MHLQLVVFFVVMFSQSSCFLQQLSAILSETSFTTLWANIAKSLENSRCFWSECCLETHVKFNITGLEKNLNQRLYGQHLVSRTVLPALKAHFSSTTSKALVLSFHGWTGGGKNYVSQFIAESIYKYGMKSTFVRYFIGGYHFPDRKLVDVYKQQLREWIKGNVSTCQYSLFIFDEVDRMPPGVLDAIKPFLEYTQMVDGVDFTKSIFIFLSNVGGSDIAKYVYDVWKQGLPRESITLQDLESIMYPVIFNEKSGFQFSELISNHLIDHFVPFLPLERVHVKLCVYDQLKRRSVQLDAATIDEILKTIAYFPNEAQIFSSSGCKRIAQKVELFIVDKSRIVAFSLYVIFHEFDMVKCGSTPFYSSSDDIFEGLMVVYGITMDENNNESVEEVEIHDPVNSAIEHETILPDNDNDNDVDGDDSVNDANDEALTAEEEQDESEVEEETDANESSTVLHDRTYFCSMRNEVRNEPRITIVKNFRLTTPAGKPCFYWGPVLFPFGKDSPTEDDDAPE